MHRKLKTKYDSIKKMHMGYFAYIFGMHQLLLITLSTS